jgi:hypothetical protein
MTRKKQKWWTTIYRRFRSLIRVPEIHDWVPDPAHPNTIRGPTLGTYAIAMNFIFNLLNIYRTKFGYK